MTDLQLRLLAPQDHLLYKSLASQALYLVTDKADGEITATRVQGQAVAFPRGTSTWNRAVTTRTCSARLMNMEKKL